MARGRFRGKRHILKSSVAQYVERMPKDISPVLVADLQRRCEQELGTQLTLAEAEQLGRRLLGTFELMFEVHQRQRIHRSCRKAVLTKQQTNETLASSWSYAKR